MPPMLTQLFTTLVCSGYAFADVNMQSEDCSNDCQIPAIQSKLESTETPADQTSDGKDAQDAIKSSLYNFYLPNPEELTKFGFGFLEALHNFKNANSKLANTTESTIEEVHDLVEVRKILKKLNFSKHDDKSSDDYVLSLKNKKNVQDNDEKTEDNVVLLNKVQLGFQEDDVEAFLVFYEFLLTAFIKFVEGDDPKKANLSFANNSRKFSMIPVKHLLKVISFAEMFLLTDEALRWFGVFVSNTLSNIFIKADKSKTGEQVNELIDAIYVAATVHHLGFGELHKKAFVHLKLRRLLTTFMTFEAQKNPVTLALKDSTQELVSLGLLLACAVPRFSTLKILETDLSKNFADCLDTYYEKALASKFHSKMPICPEEFKKPNLEIKTEKEEEDTQAPADDQSTITEEITPKREVGKEKITIIVKESSSSEKENLENLIDSPGAFNRRCLTLFLHQCSFSSELISYLRELDLGVSDKKKPVSMFYAKDDYATYYCEDINGVLSIIRDLAAEDPKKKHNLLFIVGYKKEPIKEDSKPIN